MHASRAWNKPMETRARIFKHLRSPRINSASQCSLAGRYDSIPSRFLAPILGEGPAYVASTWVQLSLNKITNTEYIQNKEMRENVHCTKSCTVRRKAFASGSSVCILWESFRWIWLKLYWWPIHFYNILGWHQSCTPLCSSEPEFLKVYGAQESIPRNEFRQPM